MKTVLTIAGSDCSGGAGIQADIKTITAHGLYAMSAITALTAQNTTGVFGVLEAGEEFVEKQLDCIFTDIFPDAVKIGMVSSAPMIRAIARKLRQYGARHVVLDPVMVSTSGSKLLEDTAIEALTGELFPCADLITPNIPEAQVLSGRKIVHAQDMERAAQDLSARYHVAVLVKGGHLVETANDYLFCGGEGTWLRAQRVENENTHGTGCTLSSAIACGLAQGLCMEDAVRHAKQFLLGALSTGLNLGKGSGPLNHCFAIGKPQW